MEGIVTSQTEMLYLHFHLVKLTILYMTIPANIEIPEIWFCDA